MAFFWGRLSRPDEPRETPFKYLTFGVVGVDWISHPRDAVAKTAFRPRLPSPPPRVVWVFSNTRSFRAAFPITVAKPSMERLSVDRAKFSPTWKERKRRFRVWPSALGWIDCCYNPSPLARPICRFSNAEPRNACCSLFGGIFGEKSIGGWIARIVDEEGIERRANPV